MAPLAVAPARLVEPLKENVPGTLCRIRLLSGYSIKLKFSNLAVSWQAALSTHLVHRNTLGAGTLAGYLNRATAFPCRAGRKMCVLPLGRSVCQPPFL